MNILYVDSGGTTSDSYMYQYYGDLLRALKQQANVYLFEGHPQNVMPVINQIEDDIDCIIFGLGFFAQSDPSRFTKIAGLEDSEITTVCMLHKPQTMLQEKLDFCRANNVDILLDYFHNSGEKAAKHSMRSWFTATPEHYHPREVEIKYDIGFSGALHGNGKIDGPTRDLRPRIGEIINSDSKYNVFWNSGNTLQYRIHSIEEYASKMNECKIWLATTGPVGDISPRYFEVALSKTLLFCNDMPDVNNPVFVDGETCVTFKNDLSDFQEKLDYYLNNDSEREKIINNAYDLVYNNYTWKHMAENLITAINKTRE